MAKKDKISGAPVVAPDPAPVAEATVAEKALNKIGTKGLTGVPLSAKITLLVERNPKRPGSAAEKKFAQYETGITQADFLERGGTTPDLAYDSAHGFISVEGYTPKKIVGPKEPRVKKEKAVKAPKVPRAKKEKTEATHVDSEAIEAAVLEETIE